MTYYPHHGSGRDRRRMFALLAVAAFVVAASLMVFVAAGMTAATAGPMPVPTPGF
jgi:hypothetical protein